MFAEDTDGNRFSLQGLSDGTLRYLDSLCREMRKICCELRAKGVDVIVFLTDSNHDDPDAWKAALSGELARVPLDARHLAVCGACQRNIECWLCAGVPWISNRLSRSTHVFQVADPKGVFESAMGITRREKCEQEIAELVVAAPMRNWPANKSFDAFYEEIRRHSKLLGCEMENLRDDFTRAWRPWAPSRTGTLSTGTTTAAATTRTQNSPSSENSRQAIR